MRVAFLADKENTLVPLLFVLFVFFIPVSMSLKSIFLVLCILAMFLIPNYRRHLSLSFNSLWGWAAVALLSFILIACIWSVAPISKSLVVLGKYAKLLYLPIFAVGFSNPKLRHQCINAYLAAMLFTCIVSLGIYLNILPPIHNDPSRVFNNRIITGFMMAFGAYLAGFYAIQNTEWKRVIYLLLAFLMSCDVLFINTSKTGCVIYCVLMTFLILQKLSLKKAMLGIVLFSSGMTLMCFENSTMYEKVHQLVADVHDLQHAQLNTSLGFRIQFHRYARSLWMQHPLIGQGTGSFKELFYQDDPIPIWGRGLTDPHSQYWMILSEQGLFGLLFLLGFIVSMLITSLKLTETRPIILGLLISFCIGSFSDTILCYSALGYLLVIMGALCFGELLEPSVSKQASQNALRGSQWEVSVPELG